ncbi:DgyrCDS14677 [Dimorphilus gyrociliatus]|uniref:DgyrCDS14677 n=1 Tax=Dimorphilus gyrociliatus TaxID=2664684 RepID=A0A7I8WEM3_9ANNE|nr:DgyrCDS14677 [Dimorphilus gyrociliatus]
MAQRPDTKVLLEPYMPCFYYSSEKKHDRHEVNLDIGYSFQKCKEMCEKEPSEKYIFIKELAYQLGGRFDALPDKFQHTFLIRNPNKTVRSLYSVIRKGEDPTYTSFDKTEAGFKQLMELFEHVTKVLGQEPIVIEADDLVNNSVGVVKKYCQMVGMDYKHCMVEWDGSTTNFKKLRHPWNPYHKHLLSTNKFENTQEGKEQEWDIPAECQEAIDESMDIYQELCKYKLKTTEQ